MKRLVRCGSRTGYVVTAEQLSELVTVYDAVRIYWGLRIGETVPWSCLESLEAALSELQGFVAAARSELAMWYEENVPEGK